MEAIPIANCSSTLPPLTQRVVPSKGLSRNLFGPVDHEEISAILNSELKRDMEEKNEEWCFNFSEGTPLGHGRLLWEKVTQRTDDELSTKSQESVVKDTRIPILHSEQCNYILGISQDIGAQCSEVATDAILKPTVTLQKSSISRKETPSNENDIPPSSDRKRKRQCRTITDFMKQKKRRRVSHSSATERDCKAKSNKYTYFNKDDISQMSNAKVHVSDKR